MSFWRGREGYRAEVSEEIAFHLEMRAREFESEGMEREEAWRAALDSFGVPEDIEREVLEMKEHKKNMRPVREIAGSFGQDLRYAARFLVRNRVFTLVAVGTLALGIGATTAIFSLLDAALFREPAVADPQSLVAVYTTSRMGEPRSSTSYPEYLDYRDQTSSLSDLAAVFPLQVSLGDEARGARMLEAVGVTGNFFPILGVEASRGRLLQRSDDMLRAGAPVAVLSHDLWRDHFGSDPAIVGRSIRLNGRAIEVVGVTHERFEGLTLGEGADLWLPMQTGGALRDFPENMWDSRGSRWIARLVGRLSPGAPPDRARSELLALSERLIQEDPTRGTRSITLDPLGSYLLPLGAETSLPRFVWLLMGVVGATLLLACANLANLLLARASARRSEIGIRIAIGAGRGRIVRQLLVESLLLAGSGGVVGLLVALGLLRALGAYELPGGLPISALGGTLDGRMLAAAAVLSAATALLCGLIPALQSTRREVAQGLHRGGGAELRHGGGRLRRALVAVQVSLCFVLLAGSGLFIHSLRSALDADLGFEPHGVIVANFSLGVLGYEPSEVLRFTEELRSRTLAQPGVSAAALANVVPFGPGGFMGTFATVDGYQPGPDEEMRVDQVFTTPGYFESLGIEILAGRDFAPADAEGSSYVAIVSRSMAELYWPGGEALGRTIRPPAAPGAESPGIQVVGIVEDAHWRAIEEDATNFVFLPLAQYPGRFAVMTMAVRTAGDVGALLPTLRGEAQGLDPELSFTLLTTLDEQVGDRLMPQRVGSVLLSGFAALALLLAAVGIVGVVSYTIREQRRAIGVRMALGAGRDRIVRQVVRSMLSPIVIGLSAGLVGTLLLDDAVETFLYGVSPGDPVTYGAIAAGLAFVALLATLVPAREAARVDPMRAMRAE